MRRHCGTPICRWRCAAPKARSVVYSTKTATNLIYDVMVCDKRFLDKAENTPVFQKFVSGWMDGVTAARANPDEAVDALVQTEEFFALLAKQEGKPFCEEPVCQHSLDRYCGQCAGAWSGWRTDHYSRVYQRFDQIYRAAGALANPKSPVIPAQDSFDYRFIKALLANDTRAQSSAAGAQYQYSDAARETAVATQEAAVTKPVMVNFMTGAADLNKRSQQVVDKEMVPFIESNGGAYFVLSGNTDSTGSAATNSALSQKRAQAVAAYLAREWDIDPKRIKVVGNGSSIPICNEANPGAEGISLEECRAMNRTTRLAVLNR